MDKLFILKIITKLILFLFDMCKSDGFPQQKRINVTTPGDYIRVSLSDICILPTSREAVSFEVMVPRDAMIDLTTSCSSCPDYYQIVIGGHGNGVAMIRKNGIDKVYLSIDNQLNENEYRPFWISWINGHIKVGRGRIIGNASTEYITWIDPDPLRITNVFVLTYDPGFFIFNDVKANIYTKVPGKRFDVKTLVVTTTLSVVACTLNCYLDLACNSFNYMKSNQECELLQSKKTDLYGSNEYDFYSEC